VKKTLTLVTYMSHFLSTMSSFDRNPHSYVPRKILHNINRFESIHKRRDWEVLN